ncbi:histone deacetylase 11 isoform X3 [Mastomys coucha]|uniref:histone deacetylase 11 isoform X3 n=1 Tax=Mastomys coucha TaxID=35658 RepID=UPI0012623B13|nr:histone deacetylase 11 isoform X3 [Mastomys coucha]
MEEACVLRRPCLLHPSHPSRCGVASRAGRAGYGMPHATQLYQHVPEKRWPIVYSPRYNITFMGLEKLHPFDAGKWGKVINFLKEEKLLSDSMLVEAREASEEDLLVVHTRRYLNELKWSFVVATITEIPPVIFLPNFLVQRKVLRPLRTQTGGTIMAGKLAVERGWAINVGGGFHHCSSDRGGGFCAYADITLAIKFLFERVEGISRATIIDLDAHQGNGHERDFMGDKRVYIMDVYNRHIYPGDRFAKGFHHRVSSLNFSPYPLHAFKTSTMWETLRHITKRSFQHSLQPWPPLHPCLASSASLLGLLCIPAWPPLHPCLASSASLLDLLCIPAWPPLHPCFCVLTLRKHFPDFCLNDAGIFLIITNSQSHLTKVNCPSKAKVLLRCHWPLVSHS